MNSEGTQGRARAARPPEIGAVLGTIHGRQQVMAVMQLASDEPNLVYLRPEHGGIEWTVPVDDLARVLDGAGR